MRFTMQSEAEFSSWFRSHLSKYGHVQRLENTVGNGVPDLVWCYQGITRWIELKVGYGHVLLRKEQFAWATRHTKAGGNVFIVHYCPVHQKVGVYKHPVAVKLHGKYLAVQDIPHFTGGLKDFSSLLQSIT